MKKQFVSFALIFSMLGTSLPNAAMIGYADDSFEDSAFSEIIEDSTEDYSERIGYLEETESTVSAAENTFVEDESVVEEDFEADAFIPGEDETEDTHNTIPLQKDEVLNPSSTIGSDNDIETAEESYENIDEETEALEDGLLYAMQEDYLDPGTSMYVQDAELLSVHLYTKDIYDPFELMDVLPEDYGYLDKDLLDASASFRLQKWGSNQWVTESYRIRAWVRYNGLSSYIRNTLEGGNLGGGDFSLKLCDQNGQTFRMPSEKEFRTGTYQMKLEYYSVASDEKTVTIKDVEEGTGYQGIIDEGETKTVTADSDGWKYFVLTAPVDSGYSVTFSADSDHTIVRNYKQNSTGAWVRNGESDSASGCITETLKQGEKSLIAVRDTVEGSSTDISLSVNNTRGLAEIEIITAYGDTVNVSEFLPFIQNGIQLRLRYYDGEEETLHPTPEIVMVQGTSYYAGIMYRDSNDIGYLVRFKISEQYSSYGSVTAETDALMNGFIPTGNVVLEVYIYDEWRLQDNAEPFTTKQISMVCEAQDELNSDNPLSYELQGTNTAAFCIHIDKNQSERTLLTDTASAGCSFELYKTSSLNCQLLKIEPAYGQTYDFNQPGDYIAVIRGSGEDGTYSVNCQLCNSPTIDSILVLSNSGSIRDRKVSEVVENIKVRVTYKVTKPEELPLSSFDELYVSPDGEYSFLMRRLNSGRSIFITFSKSTGVELKPVLFSDLQEELEYGSYCIKAFVKAPISVKVGDSRGETYITIAPQIENVEIISPYDRNASLTDILASDNTSYQVRVLYKNGLSETLNPQGKPYVSGEFRPIGLQCTGRYKDTFLLRVKEHVVYSDSLDNTIITLQNGVLPVGDIKIELYNLKEWLAAESSHTLNEINPIAVLEESFVISTEYELSEDVPVQIELPGMQATSIRIHADNRQFLSLVTDITEEYSTVCLYKLENNPPRRRQQLRYITDIYNGKTKLDGDYIAVFHNRGEETDASGSFSLQYLPDIANASFVQEQFDYFETTFYEEFDETLQSPLFSVTAEDGRQEIYSGIDMDHQVDDSWFNYLEGDIFYGKKLCLELTDEYGAPVSLRKLSSNSYMPSGNYTLKLLEETEDTDSWNWRQLAETRIRVQDAKINGSLEPDHEKTLLFEQGEKRTTQWIDLRGKQGFYKLTILGSDRFAYKYWEKDESPSLLEYESLPAGEKQKEIYLDSGIQYYLDIWNQDQPRISLLLTKVDDSGEIISASLVGELGRTCYVAGFPVYGEPIFEGSNWETGLYNLGSLGVKVHYQKAADRTLFFRRDENLNTYHDSTGDIYDNWFEISVSSLRDGVPFMTREYFDDEDPEEHNIECGFYKEPGTYALVLQTEWQLPGKDETDKWRMFSIISPNDAARDCQFSGEFLELENPDDYYLFAGFNPEQDGFQTIKADHGLSFAQFYELGEEDSIPAAVDTSLNADSFVARLEKGKNYLIAIRASTAGQKITLQRIVSEGIISEATLSRNAGAVRPLIAGIESVDLSSFSIGLSYQNPEEDAAEINGRETDRFGNSFRFVITDSEGNKVDIEDSVNSDIILQPGDYQIKAVHSSLSSIQTQTVNLNVELPDIDNCPAIEEQQPLELGVFSRPTLFRFVPEHDSLYLTDGSGGKGFSFYQIADNTVVHITGVLKAGEAYLAVCPENYRKETVVLVPSGDNLSGTLAEGTNLDLPVHNGDRIDLSFTAQEEGEYILSVTAADKNGLALTCPKILAGEDEKNLLHEGSGNTFQGAVILSENEQCHIQMIWQGKEDTLGFRINKKKTPVSAQAVPREDIRQRYWAYLASGDAGMLYNVTLFYTEDEVTQIEEEGEHDCYGNTYWCDQYKFEECHFDFYFKDRQGYRYSLNNVKQTQEFNDSIDSLNEVIEGETLSVVGDESGWQVYRFTSQEDGDYKISAGGYGVKVIDPDTALSLAGDEYVVPWVTESVHLSKGVTCVIAVDTRELLEGASEYGVPAFDLIVSRRKTPAAMSLKTTPLGKMIPGAAASVSGMAAEVTYSDGTVATVYSDMKTDPYGNTIRMQERIVSADKTCVYMFCGDQFVSCEAERPDIDNLPHLRIGTAFIEKEARRYFYAIFIPVVSSEYALGDSDICLSESYVYLPGQGLITAMASGMTLQKGVAYILCLRAKDSAPDTLAVTLTLTDDPCTKGEHEWGDWEVTIEPDCLHEGQKARYCLLCNTADTPASIPSTGAHIWEQTDPVIDEEAGTQTVYDQCKICGTVQNPVVRFTTEKQAELDAFASTLMDDFASVAEKVDIAERTGNETLVLADTQCSETDQTNMILISQLEQQLYQDDFSSDITTVAKIAETITGTPELTVVGASVTAAAASMADIRNLDSTCEDTYQAVVRISEPELGTDEVGKATCTLDISLYVRKNAIQEEERKTQLAAPIMITMAVPAGYEEMGFDLYHHVEKEDGSVTKVKMEYTRNPDNTITFVTPSLSDFTFENAVCSSHNLVQKKEDERYVEATCTEGGTEVWGCSNTFCIYEEVLNTQPVAHFWVMDSAVEPTCQNEGRTVGWHCAVCGQSDEDHPAVAVLEKTQHKYTSWMVQDEAGCDHTGSKYRNCVICKVKETVEIPATEKHNWGSWKTVLQPTAVSEGKQEQTCSVCGKSNHKAIAKLRPTMKITGNIKTLTLQKGKSTSGLSVSGMAKGDYVRGWSSSDSKVFTVNGTKNGTCTIKAGKKAKSAKLTIILASGLKRTITVKVQQKPVAVAKLTLLNVGGTLKLKKGNKFTVKLGIDPFTALIKPVFKSNKPKIAAVSKKGIITAKKPGKAKITVKCGKKKKTITVEVTR